MLTATNYTDSNLMRLPAITRFYQVDILHSLEKIGFKFGEPLPNHSLPLLELPKGWKIQEAKNPLRLFIVDEKEQKRIEIFNGVRAYTEIRLALYPCTVKETFKSRTRISVIIRRAGKTIFSTKPVITRRRDDDYVEDLCYTEARKAEEWLNTHYPKHRNPLAYWD